MYCAILSLCIVQLYVHALYKVMSMHWATWCPFIVQLVVHTLCNLTESTLCPCIYVLCNFMTMHCATLWIYNCAIWQVNLMSMYLCIVQPMSMHCATLCLCIVQGYVHALSNLIAIHCATWCPYIVQLDVHSLSNLMSIHCATCCPYIVQPYVHVFMYCATLWPCIVQLYGHALYKIMSMHWATWCHWACWECK